MTHRVESRIHVEGDLYRFEIVDNDDVIASAEGDLPESLHLSKTYAREATAESNAKKWINRFRAATDSVKRRMCGYDKASDCPPSDQRERVHPVRRRISTK